MSSITQKDGVTIAIDEIRQSAAFIQENLTGHYVSWDGFRFCLELYQRALLNSAAVVSPSLEIGMGDGFSSYFCHRDKPLFDFGSDWPSGISVESWAIGAPIQFDHYKKIIGMDMANMPFADNSFASIFSAHSMHSGQHLEKSLEEIFRVLAPGATCYLVCTLDTWIQFKLLMEWIRSVTPAITLHSKERHLELISKLGAVNIQHRTFMPAALASVLLGYCNHMPFLFRGTLSAEIGMNEEVDGLVEMMSDIFCTIIEKELALPQGPEDGFNIFISFQKPGTMPANLVMPAPLCTTCRGELVDRDISTKVCNSCGQSYFSYGAVPMLFGPGSLSAQSIIVREEAAAVSRTTDEELTRLLLPLKGKSYFILYDGHSTVPGCKAPGILVSCMQFNNVGIAGIIANNVETVRTWKNCAIIHLESVPDGAEYLLFTADVNQPERWAAKLRKEGKKGTLHALCLVGGAAEVRTIAI